MRHHYGRRWVSLLAHKRAACCLEALPAAASVHHHTDVCCIQLCSGIMFLLCVSFTHSSSAEDGGTLSARRPARRGSFVTLNVGPLARLIGFVLELQRSPSIFLSERDSAGV